MPKTNDRAEVFDREEARNPSVVGAFESTPKDFTDAARIQNQLPDTSAKSLPLAAVSKDSIDFSPSPVELVSGGRSFTTLLAGKVKEGQGADTIDPGAAGRRTAPTDAAPDAGRAAGDARKSVVSVRANLGDGSDFGAGSGFPVDPSGGRNDLPDGKRYFATAFHVVGDYKGELHRITNAMRETRLATTAGGFALREGVQAFLDEHQDDSRYSQVIRPQLEHALKHYDDIYRISKELNPVADGISENGLHEFYRRNHSVMVQTAHGNYMAKVVGHDAKDDVAILEVSGLTPDQERSFGSNLSLANQDARLKDQIIAYGFVRSQLQERLSEVSKTKARGAITRDGDRFFQGSSSLTPGMSGGPAMRFNPITKQDEVLGVNHGDQGIHSPTSNIWKLINRLTIEKKL